MTRIPLVSALAALAMMSDAGIMSANAADLSYSHRTYNQNRDSGYSDAYKKPAPQQTRRDDDDDDHNVNYGRHRHHGEWGHLQNLYRVEARASYAGDYMPDYVKEWRAKSSAIDIWKSKVASLYGEQFAHWRTAEDKQVNCDAGAGSVYCTVSARPARGWSRWSWNRDRDFR